MSEWQPIETAPPDVPVLVFDPYLHDGAGAWCYCRENRPSVFVAVFDSTSEWWTGDLVELEGGWESTGSFTVTQQLYPTHWMPLPEPPK